MLKHKIMARYLRNYLYLPFWMSRFLIILAVPALGQVSRDSAIDMCGTHNFTYSNTIDIHKNADTTNAEKCQCDVYVSGNFQFVISFSFPQTVVECGEGFTIHTQGQTIVQRCSRLPAAYSENDKAYYSNEHIQIIYKSRGKVATLGWFRAKINGKMIHVVCNINEAKDPPSQPGQGSPGNATTAQPPVGPENQSSPPPGTGQEKELTTPSGPRSGDQPPSPPSPGSGDQPSPTPSPGSGDHPSPSPSPGSGDQPTPTPNPGSGYQPSQTPAARPGNIPSPPSGTGQGNESTPPPSPGSGNEPPPPPSPGSGNQTPPPSDNLRRTIMIAVVAISTIVSVAGLVGIAVVCFRRRKRAPNVENGRHEQQVHYTAKNKWND